MRIYLRTGPRTGVSGGPVFWLLMAVPLLVVAVLVAVGYLLAGIIAAVCWLWSKARGNR